MKHTNEMYSTIAWGANAYFRTARDTAFKTNSQLRFHRFDGTGFFNFRFRRKGTKVEDGYFEELFLSDKPKNKNHVAFGGLFLGFSLCDQILIKNLF